MEDHKEGSESVSAEVGGTHPILQKRKGGRPKGSKNTRPRRNRLLINRATGNLTDLRNTVSDAIEKAILTGLMPVEFMLQVMRNPKNDTALRLKAAVECAPYLHPRLAFVQQEKTTNRSALQEILKMMEEERRLISEKRGQHLAHYQDEEPVTIDQEHHQSEQILSSSEQDQQSSSDQIPLSPPSSSDDP